MIAQPIRLLHAGSGRPNIATALGLRRCYRTENYFHGADDPECDCLRTEIPIEAQASSSGALATGHAEMAHKGRVESAFETMESAMTGWRKAWSKCSDRELRRKVSAARAGKKIGRKA